VTAEGHTIYLGERHFHGIIVGIAQGLSVLHERGVVHRDLKPENVMLGNGLRIKLLDFGLARELIGSCEGKRVSSEGSDANRLPAWSGTLGYIAPERLEGTPLRASSDVFSFGVILYEFVTGSRPFAGDQPLAFLEATRTPPDFTVDRWTRFSSLKGVTARMLSREPEVRFANGTEALRALRHALGYRQIASTSATARATLKGVILWVDDEPEKNATAIVTFESIGLHVMASKSTKEALDFLRRHAEHRQNGDIVVVISDIARADGPREGYVLLDALRSRSDSTPFFIYSSSAVEEDKRETLQRGGQGCTNNDHDLFEMVVAEIRGRQ
jgi:serine/threonine protein kinase